MIRMPSARVLLQSVDVITPVSRNPRVFGSVAAAHALSDIYAKGAKPISGLITLGYPEKEVSIEVLAEIVLGAISTLEEAQATFLGGHTYLAPELVVGLSVTGAADRIVTNQSAQVGDVLFISKPIGTGIIIAAERYNEEEHLSSLTEEMVATAEAQMVELNARVAELVNIVSVNSATDVSGFGLVGHLIELLDDNTAAVNIESVPVLPGVLQLLSEGFLPTGADRNIAEWLPMCEIENSSAAERAPLLFDPQTNGGILMSVPSVQVAAFTEAAHERRLQVSEIGVVTPPRESRSGPIVSIR